MSESLLPFTASDLERACEAATTRELPVPNAELWNPWTCPAAFLPWLAHSLSVDSWDSRWTEEEKRNVIASTVFVHRRKGTIGAVREALRSAGLGEIDIIEGFKADRYDASFLRDGSKDRAPADHWSEYRVIARRPVSIRQAAQARKTVTRTAPVRCTLKIFDFSQVANLYDGAIRRDGAYTRGVV